MSQSCIQGILILCVTIVTTSVAFAQNQSERDPTRPQQFSATYVSIEGQEGSELSLRMISYSEHQRSARINGQLLREGMEVGGWTVIQIEPAQVFLQRGTEILRLTVFGGSQIRIEARDNT